MFGWRWFRELSFASKVFVVAITAVVVALPFVVSERDASEPPSDALVIEIGEDLLGRTLTVQDLAILKERVGELDTFERCGQLYGYLNEVFLSAPDPESEGAITGFAIAMYSDGTGSGLFEDCVDGELIEDIESRLRERLDRISDGGSRP